MGSAGGTVLVGGHAEVLLGVFAEETKAREIHLAANLFDTPVRLAEQLFNLLHADLIDNRLCRFACVSIRCGCPLISICILPFLQSISSEHSLC